MASDSDRPEITAFLELEHLVRNVGEALAGFRRRALTAETQLKEIDAVSAGKPTSPKRVAELEAEIRQLRSRLDQATNRTQQMLDRVRFLRQQQVRGE